MGGSAVKKQALNVAYDGGLPKLWALDGAAVYAAVQGMAELSLATRTGDWVPSGSQIFQRSLARVTTHRSPSYSTR
jgi:hypothetical protein